MPEWDDLSLFLDTDDFAVEVMADGRSFPAIFDVDGDSSEIGGIMVESVGPSICCREEDASPFIWRESTVHISNRDYTVMTVKPDETGMSIVELAECS